MVVWLPIIEFLVLSYSPGFTLRYACQSRFILPLTSYRHPVSFLSPMFNLHSVPFEWRFAKGRASISLNALEQVSPRPGLAGIQRARAVIKSKGGRIIPLPRLSNQLQGLGNLQTFKRSGRFPLPLLLRARRAATRGDPPFHHHITIPLCPPFLWTHASKPAARSGKPMDPHPPWSPVRVVVAGQ